MAVTSDIMPVRRTLTVCVANSYFSSRSPRLLLTMVPLSAGILNISSVIIIIIIAEMAVFNVAGYLIEERRKRPVITASPRGEHSK